MTEMIDGNTAALNNKEHDDALYEAKRKALDSKIKDQAKLMADVAMVDQENDIILEVLAECRKEIADLFEPRHDGIDNEVPLRKVNIIIDKHSSLSKIVREKLVEHYTDEAEARVMGFYS